MTVDFIAENAEPNYAMVDLSEHVKHKDLGLKIVCAFGFFGWLWLVIWGVARVL